MAALVCYNGDGLIDHPPSLPERVFVQALEGACRHAGPHDPWDLLQLIRMEGLLGVPVDAAGILAGVWCVEAAWRREARQGGNIYGDFRGGVAMAHGPFQLWPTTRAACNASGEAPFDLAWSAWCWVWRVGEVEPKAARHCSKNTWRVAEAAVSNIRRYRWSCREWSAHWEVARKARATFARWAEESGSCG